MKSISPLVEKTNFSLKTFTLYRLLAQKDTALRVKKIIDEHETVFADSEECVDAFVSAPPEITVL